MVLEFLISLKKKDFKKKRFHLKFRNYKCDNGCFSKFYQEYGNKVFFPPNKNNTEGFFTLNKEDRKFVAALWVALPKLLNHAQLVAVKYIEDTYIPILETWKKELNEFRKLSLKSPYEKYVPDFKLTIKEEDYPNSNMMDNKMMSNMMVPKVVELDDEIASRNVEDYLGKIEDLNINMGKELSDLLLSIQPVTNQNENVNIGSLLKDPAFQLN